MRSFIVMVLFLLSPNALSQASGGGGGNCPDDPISPIETFLSQNGYNNISITVLSNDGVVLLQEIDADRSSTLIETFVFSEFDLYLPVDDPALNLARGLSSVHTQDIDFSVVETYDCVGGPDGWVLNSVLGGQSITEESLPGGGGPDYNHWETQVIDAGPGFQGSLTPPYPVQQTATQMLVNGENASEIVHVDIDRTLTFDPSDGSTLSRSGYMYARIDRKNVGEPLGPTGDEFRWGRITFLANLEIGAEDELEGEYYHYVAPDELFYTDEYRSRSLLYKDTSSTTDPDFNKLELDEQADVVAYFIPNPNSIGARSKYVDLRYNNSFTYEIIDGISVTDSADIQSYHVNWQKPLSGESQGQLEMASANAANASTDYRRTINYHNIPGSPHHGKPSDVVFHVIDDPDPADLNPLADEVLNGSWHETTMELTATYRESLFDLTDPITDCQTWNDIIDAKVSLEDCALFSEDRDLHAGLMEDLKNHCNLN